MNLFESNKLIANSIFASFETKNEINHYQDSGNDLGLEEFYSKLNYHKDWNQLIYVCKKFIELEDVLSKLQDYHNYKKLIITSLNKIDILELHEEIIFAIKWYNQNLKLFLEN